MGILNKDMINALKERSDLDFSDALYLLTCGFKLRRNAWKEMQFVELQKPDENSKMKHAYLYAIPLDGQAVPYSVSNLDLFQQDWSVYRA